MSKKSDEVNSGRFARPKNSKTKIRAGLGEISPKKSVFQAEILADLPEKCLKLPEITPKQKFGQFLVRSAQVYSGTLFSIRFNFISRQKNQQHSYSHKPNLLN